MNIVERSIQKVREDGFASFIREAYKTIYRSISRSVIQPILFKLYEFGLLDVDNLYKPQYYDNMARGAARDDAHKFSSVLNAKYDPDFVIDIGCGVGRFLEYFQLNGLNVIGYDGSKYACENPVNDDITIHYHDLTNPLHFENEADLVMCIEVLEHLPNEAAATAVKTISRAGPIAVVTAAEPGQGGTYHVNEQQPSFWIDLFESEGMAYDKSDSKQLSDVTGFDELDWLNGDIYVFKQV